MSSGLCCPSWIQSENKSKKREKYLNVVREPKMSGTRMWQWDQLRLAQLELSKKAKEGDKKNWKTEEESKFSWLKDY